MDAGKFSDSITPLWSSGLDAPPSCLEFVPRDHNPGLEYFVVGTYTLLSSDNQAGDYNEEVEQSEEQAPRPTKSQEKSGGLKLFRIDHDKV
jgi:diphthamide biosynthesis protein 7